MWCHLVGRRVWILQVKSSRGARHAQHVCLHRQTPGRHAGKRVGMQVGRQAGRHVGRHAGGQAGRHAGGHASRQTDRQASYQGARLLPLAL